MRGFGAFFAKELREIVSTWRIWVIPGMLVFFAVSSPFVALLTPALVSSLVASQPGVSIQLPEPTAQDAFGQFLKNLSQIVLIAVVISGAGTISGERASGTAVLVLTKPLSRSAFVVAKVLADQLLLVGFTAATTLLTFGVTVLVFEPVSPGPLLAAVGLWLAFALLLVVVMTLCSVLFSSRGAAAGAGLGFLFLTLLLGTWPKAAASTFAGLLGSAGRALTGQPVAPLWPLLTAAVAAAGAVAASVWVFRRQEL